MTIWQLMKNLRDKWWIPRWYNEVIHTVYDKKHKMIWLYKEGKEFLILVYKKSLRDLCSKESNLWQFCVDHDIIDYSKVRAYWISYAPLKKWGAWEMQNYDNVHRLLWDCASLDENKLEQFLLDNIKIECLKEN